MSIIKKHSKKTKKIKRFIREERREINELKTHKQGRARFFIDSLRLMYDYFIPHAGNDHKPLHLRPRALLGYAALAVSMKVLVIGFLFISYPTPASVSAIISQNIISLINTSRTQAGDQPLQDNIILDQAALAKGEDMMQRGYFNHDTPEGKHPWQWIDKNQYDYVFAGENLAIDFTSAEKVHEALMNSAKHRENILNPDYKDIGIAVITDTFQGRTTTLLVQFFGAKRNTLQAATVSTSGITSTKISHATNFITPTSVLGVMNIQKLPVIGTQPRSMADRLLEFSHIFFLGFAIFMLLSLVLNILVKVRVQHRQVVLQTLALIAFLTALAVIRLHGLESISGPIHLL